MMHLILGEVLSKSLTLRNAHLSSSTTLRTCAAAEHMRLLLHLTAITARLTWQSGPASDHAGAKPMHTADT